MATDQTPKLTFKFQGGELPFAGLTDDRKGIKSEGAIYWMFPAVKEGGGALDPGSLPPVGPVAILPITIRVPDLTLKYPDTVQSAYEERRHYYKGVTRNKHVKLHPHDGWMGAEQFQEGKNLVLNQTLEEYSVTWAAREAVWRKHRTKEMADAVGLLGFGPQQCLIQWFKNSGMSEEQAKLSLTRLRYVALYEDPDRTRLYLYDLIAQPDSQAAERELMRRQAKEQSERLEALTGQVSDVAQMLHDQRAAAPSALNGGQPQIEDTYQGKPRIVFAKGFREIRYPAGVLKMPKPRNRARVLKVLYERWKADPGEWTDWASLGEEAGYSDPTVGFFRNVEDRSRPEVRAVIGSFVDVETAVVEGSQTFRVRLKTGFHYERWD